MVKRANGVVTTAGGLLGHVTSGPPDEIWKENNPFELDGERLYEAHDVSRALKALNLSWPEGLPESTTGGGVVERQNTSAGEIGRCERRGGTWTEDGTRRRVPPPCMPARGALPPEGPPLFRREGPKRAGRALLERGPPRASCGHQ